MELPNPEPRLAGPRRHPHPGPGLRPPERAGDPGRGRLDGKPLRSPGHRRQPRPAPGATRQGRRRRRPDPRGLLERGANLDLGLAQINSDNLEWLGLNPEAAFDPCRNLAAADRVLRAGYRPKQDETPQQSLRVALSRYNTGHPERGFRNGYVARVEAAAGTLGLAPRERPFPAQTPIAAADSPVEQRPVADWDVFGRAQASARLVFASTANASGGQK